MQSTRTMTGLSCVVAMPLEFCKQKFLLCNLKTVSDILATFVLLTWSMSILVENCKMDGSQI